MGSAGWSGWCPDEIHLHQRRAADCPVLNLHPLMVRDTIRNNWSSPPGLCCRLQCHVTDPEERPGWFGRPGLRRGSRLPTWCRRGPAAASRKSLASQPQREPVSVRSALYSAFCHGWINRVVAPLTILPDAPQTTIPRRTSDHAAVRSDPLVFILQRACAWLAFALCICQAKREPLDSRKGNHFGQAACTLTTEKGTI